MTKHEDLNQRRTSLLSRLNCFDDSESCRVQNRFRQKASRAASRLPMMPFNPLKSESSLRGTPVATIEAVKSKTLFCNARRLRMASSLLGRCPRRTMSPRMDKATEGLVFPRISGFWWAIGSGNRNPTQWHFCSFHSVCRHWLASPVTEPLGHKIKNGLRSQPWRGGAGRSGRGFVAWLLRLKEIGIRPLFPLSRSLVRSGLVSWSLTNTLYTKTIL